MKKKVLALIIILAVTLGVIVFNTSTAWFVTGDSDKSQAINISYFNYSLVGGCDIRPAFIDPSIEPPDNNEFAAPGENMIYVEESPGVWTPGNLAVMNKSNITTNLRVKIEYSWWNGSALEQVYYGDQTGDFTVTFAIPADWQYDSGTKCWNYLPGGNDIPAVDLGANPSGIETDLITFMGYSSAIINLNNYKNLAVTVKLKVEAKQADYAEWTDVST